MYVEDQAGTDITVTVEGEEYDAEATMDVDADGIDDTAVSQHEDGTSLGFSDTDGDGEADLMTRFDKDGSVLATAGYDAASGDWIGTEPGADTVEQIRADTPEGQVIEGPATHDTDGDGVHDSVVVAGDDATSTIFTDVDGDGGADVYTRIAEDGEVTVAEHRGDGEWSVVERSRIGDDGADDRTDTVAEDSDWEDWGDGSDGRVESTVSVDPATGRWVHH